MLFRNPELNHSICAEILDSWFKKPVYNKSKYFLDMLELFDDFGCNKKIIKEEWTIWVATIYKKAQKLNNNELELWIRIGKEINGEEHYIKKLNAEIERRKEEDIKSKTKDCFKELNNIKFAIFTLREDPAKRVKSKLEEKNKEIEVNIFSKKKLTRRAVSHAKNSIGIVVGDSIKHASVEGLKDSFKKNRYDSNPLYPRSGGECAIMDEIELYTEKYLC